MENLRSSGSPERGEIKNEDNLNKQLNQAKGITIPVKRKNMKLPKRKIVLPKVSHNFLNIAWGFHAWHVYQVH